MIDWWNSLSVAMRIIWGLTLGSSLVFVIQTVMTFLGADADTADLEIDSEVVDGDGAGIQILSFRNFVNFCMGFGWSAILLESEIPSTTLRLVISCIIGVCLVALVMLLFKWVASLQQSGNINVFKSAVDCPGTVYLPIPAERGGQGKVQIEINGTVREYDAVTDGPALKTGAKIRVVEALSADTLLVEEIDNIIV